MSAKSSDLIQLRMKLVGGRAVVSENEKVSRSIKGLGRSTSETAAKQRFAERSASRLTTSYKRLGSAAKYGFGFLGVSGAMAVHSSIAATEELGKATSSLSRNYGFATNVASRWAAVMASRESDPKALTQALGTLSTKMVTAGREGGKALTPFHLLGLSQEEVARGAKDFEWGLLRVADALGKEAGSSKRSAAAKALLGKGFQLLTPLFSEGTKGLKEQLHWADKYGVTLNTTTKDGIMEMVSAQRENKVAMLGLQLSLTKALMPAIKAGDEQLQEFIATLNSPNLTKEQKISRISHQFLMLEKDLVEVIEKAIPHVAEEGGRLGVALGGAVWHGFAHSSLEGKLVITAWLAKFMGGGALIRSAAGSVGRMIAWGLVAALMPRLAEEFAVTGSVGLMLKARWANLGKVSGLMFTTGWLLGTVGIGFLLAEQLDKQIHFRQWGINAGQNFINALIWLVNQGIGLINNTLDQANALAILGVDAPNIPEIGNVDFGAPEPPKGKFGLPSPDLHHPGNPFHIGGRGHKSPRGAAQSRTRRRAELMAMPRGAGGRSGQGGTLVIHNHLHADGREIAELVTEHALDAAALA